MTLDPQVLAGAFFWVGVFYGYVFILMALIFLGVLWQYKNFKLSTYFFCRFLIEESNGFVETKYLCAFEEKNRREIDERFAKKLKKHFKKG